MNDANGKVYRNMSYHHPFGCIYPCTRLQLIRTPYILSRVARNGGSAYHMRQTGDHYGTCASE